MKNKVELPSTFELQKELNRENYKSKYKTILKSTIYILLIVCAISVLIATLVFPVLKIYGTSMYPNLNKDDIVVASKKKEYKRGEIIAFYYNNRILVKRVIAVPGEWIEIDDAGNVFINGEFLEEKYISDKSIGETDLKYPYQVTENTYFVMGDKRDTSIDSRSSTIGTIKSEDIIGKIVFTVWPLAKFGVNK
ncbi:MAG: signal peptidase I [Erysipelotrichaceae bacterium]|nr:signal peptidase I [Erysipelotrichaceae bacterium]